MHPIAVGCTLRRLVAKYAGSLVREEMGELLSPRQLGYGVKRGAEAVVRAARLFVQNLEVDQVFVKLDFTNAFNTLRCCWLWRKWFPKFSPLFMPKNFRTLR